MAEERKTRIGNKGPVAIANVQYSGDEHVVVKNNGAMAVNIGGWTLRDKNDTGQRCVFPTGTHIPAAGAVQVYTKPGYTYSFNSKRPIWNDHGDAAELLDANGNVVATYAYGNHLIKLIK